MARLERARSSRRKLVASLSGCSTPFRGTFSPLLTPPTLQRQQQLKVTGPPLSSPLAPSSDYFFVDDGQNRDTDEREREIEEGETRKQALT
jgi:hypothetical protein